MTVRVSSRLETGRSGAKVLMLAADSFVERLLTALEVKVSPWPAQLGGFALVFASVLGWSTSWSDSEKSATTRAADMIDLQQQVNPPKGALKWQH